MGDLFVRAVQRGCQRPAVTDERGELTFEEFGRRLSALVAHWQACGLRPGDSIAQLSRNTADAVCVIGAAFVLGLRYTPLHPLASPTDQAFILSDAAIECLVIDERHFADRVPMLERYLVGRRLVFSHGPADFGQALQDVAPAPTAELRSFGNADDVALIAYTGGTTGRPKGVVHRHRSLVTNVLISLAEWEWRHPERFLAVTPISHAAFLFMLPVMLKGGAIVLRESFSPDNFARVVQDKSVTSTFLVPTMIYALLDDPALDPKSLASLQTVIYGAAAIDPERLAEAVRRLGPRFAQLYGQTEAPNAVTMLFKRDHDLSRPDHLASCGVPLTGVDVRLLDDAGSPVKAGAIGEICVRGPLVMDGYWKRPEETREAIRDGWLHTGDLARSDADGFLTIVDRRKDMIISGGFNVYPREVEDALTDHPTVAQACVVGLPHPRWGEAVAALVVLKSAGAASEEELIEHVKSLKGSVHAPKHVRLVAAIPSTALGKPDKKEARALFLASGA